MLIILKMQFIWQKNATALEKRKVDGENFMDQKHNWIRYEEFILHGGICFFVEEE